MGREGRAGWALEVRSRAQGGESDPTRSRPGSLARVGCVGSLVLSVRLRAHPWVRLNQLAAADKSNKHGSAQLGKPHIPSVKLWVPRSKSPRLKH